MFTSDHRVILQELALYTTFLAGALSPTAVPTFCELLFGSMLSGQGFITQALLSLGQYECLWSSYHHWVSQGRWRWKHLACHLIRLVCSKVPKDKCISLILDDTLIERFSNKAPLAARITNIARSAIDRALSGDSAGFRWRLSSSEHWMKYSRRFLS